MKNGVDAHRRFTIKWYDKANRVFAFVPELTIKGSTYGWGLFVSMQMHMVRSTRNGILTPAEK